MNHEDYIEKARELVRLCGGSYSRAVEVVSALERTLWELSFKTDRPGKEVMWPEGAFSRINTSDLYDRFPFSQDLADFMLDRLEASKMSRNVGNDKLGFKLEIFQPFSMVRTLLNGLRPDSDLRYFVMRDIRKRYDCDLSPRVAHSFQFFANALNSYRVVSPPEGKSKTALETRSNVGRETRPKYIWKYRNELLEYLKAVPRRNDWIEKGKDVQLFIECCRSVGYLLPHFESGHVDIRTARIDAAYLLSNLFGMPTRMRGFDELFGGGGIMLTEALNGQSSGPTLGGRSVLIMGRFGTGKSILSVQLAVEVARKGGAAWIMLLEQSYQECLYTLEAMGALRHDQSMEVAIDVLTASEMLTSRKNDRGALIISQANKNSFAGFLAEVSNNAERMKQFSLRLVCVDPINSIQRQGQEPVVLRDDMVKTFSHLKRTGTNVLLVGETGNESESDLLFEQNIADTVIHLSVDKRHGYAARHFEIQKSRHQREQRGRHPFSIIPGAGVRIYASSAAVSARMIPRGTSEHRESIEYGMPALDEILGEGSITSGDVVVFQGEGGSFKTPLGLIFLLGTEKRKRRRNELPSRSLLVSARDDEATIEHLLDQGFIQDHIKRKNSMLPVRFKSKKDIIVCSLPLGFIQPGQILQRLEDEITEARLKGYWIDRIMIDDVAHWEMSSPFISEDETFGDTLLDFLHRHRVTALIVCGPAPTASSIIQRPIIDGSDCLIQFERIEFRGSNRVMLQVLKTRGMRHRRESFEVNLGSRTLDVLPTSSLLRAVRGEIKPVRIRLFLNSESTLKQQYSNRVMESLKSILSEDTAVVPQDLLSQNNVLKLGRHSAVDELQVVQFDEFQLPSLVDSGNPDFVLYKFPANQWDENVWGDFLPSVQQRIRSNDGSFFALPFYENVSLLAYRKLHLDASQMSWGELAEECNIWEHDHTNPKEIFFDFPKASPENYNSLFLEILLQLSGEAPMTNKCGLERLLERAEAVEAGRIYRRLCRRAYLSSGENEVVVRQMQAKRLPVMVSKDALVWRHWYTSLNQMLHTFDPRDREEIQVSSLPGGVSIAGEWYLGVTAYSAAPDIGLEVIKLLTSHEAELTRLQTGIGLPARSSFYGGATSDTVYQSPVSPYVNMNMGVLKELIDNAHRRSNFGCYSQMADTFAHHLQRIIAIPDADEAMIEKKIKENFESLITRLGFISSELICGKCKWTH